ncbi:MAG TPA: DUF5134 domain-containing protein [Mycobacterium sp.]|nr:DUF5134 domain-containing protein [Mycobacterium sp.]HTX98210.1 DUF5134 domain-containing protein [Mycobacterium sp.]
MAWRVGTDLPTFGPMIFFLAAAAWFLWVAGRGLADPMANHYYAAMMAAMAWMYAVMNGSMHPPGPNMSTSAMDMSAHSMPLAAAGPWWMTTVNWVAAVGFAAVALYWPYRYFAERRIALAPRAAGPGRFEVLYQAFTAGGTAPMFGALL